jgi:hypothetical protein
MLECIKRKKTNLIRNEVPKTIEHENAQKFCGKVVTPALMRKGIFLCG